MLHIRDQEHSDIHITQLRSVHPDLPTVQYIIREAEYSLVTFSRIDLHHSHRPAIGQRKCQNNRKAAPTASMSTRYNGTNNHHPPSPSASLPIPEVNPQTLPTGVSETSFLHADIAVRPAVSKNSNAKRKCPAPPLLGRTPPVPQAVLEHLQLMLDSRLYLRLQESLTTGRLPPVAITNFTTLESVCTAPAPGTQWQD